MQTGDYYGNWRCDSAFFGFLFPKQQEFFKKLLDKEQSLNLSHDRISEILKHNKDLISEYMRFKVVYYSLRIEEHTKTQADLDEFISSKTQELIALRSANAAREAETAAKQAAIIQRIVEKSASISHSK